MWFCFLKFGYKRTRRLPWALWEVGEFFPASQINSSFTNGGKQLKKRHNLNFGDKIRIRIKQKSGHSYHSSAHVFCFCVVCYSFNKKIIKPTDDLVSSISRRFDWLAKKEEWRKFIRRWTIKMFCKMGVKDDNNKKKIQTNFENTKAMHKDVGVKCTKREQNSTDNVLPFVLLWMPFQLQRPKNQN